MAHISGLQCRGRSKKRHDSVSDMWRHRKTLHTVQYLDVETESGARDTIALHELALVSPQSMRTDTMEDRMTQFRPVVAQHTEKRKRGRPRKTAPPAQSQRHAEEEAWRHSPEHSAQLPDAPERSFDSGSLEGLMGGASLVSVPQACWTPVQRIGQLNQALSQTEHYHDMEFWERLCREFFAASSTLRLELSRSECEAKDASLHPASHDHHHQKTFILPAFVVPKLFWIWTQHGLRRLQLAYGRIHEALRADETVEFASDDAQLTSLSADEHVLVTHAGPQFIVFDYAARIISWTVRAERTREFVSSGRMAADACSRLEFGIDRDVLLFLDAAAVMATVLPDAGPWNVWFQSFLCQHRQQSYNAPLTDDFTDGLVDGLTNEFTNEFTNELTGGLTNEPTSEFTSEFPNEPTNEFTGGLVAISHDMDSRDADDELTRHSDAMDMRPVLTNVDTELFLNLDPSLLPELLDADSLFSLSPSASSFDARLSHDGHIERSETVEHNDNSAHEHNDNSAHEHIENSAHEHSEHDDDDFFENYTD